MNIKNLALAFAGICLSVMVASAQPVQTRTISYPYSFIPSDDGGIRYTVKIEMDPLVFGQFSELGVFFGPEILSGDSSYIDALRPLDPYDPVIPGPTTILLHTEIKYHWYSPEGLFDRRVITAQEALTVAGLPQGAIDCFVAMLESSLNANTIRFLDSLQREYAPVSQSWSLNPQSSAKGKFKLNVTIPDHPGNRWILKVIGAYPEVKYCPLTLTPGSHEITVTGVEAGNVIVNLFATDANGSVNSYWQQTNVEVTKDGATYTPDGQAIASINMEFAEPDSPDRYRISYLGVGHNSQSQRANLELQRDREAMVRTRVYDAYGNGGKSTHDQRLRITWSLPNGLIGSKTFTTQISGNHIRSGLLQEKYPDEINRAINEKEGLGLKIPKEFVQPGLTVTATLLNQFISIDPDGADYTLLPFNRVADTKTIQPVVLKPRRIHIYGYDVHAEMPDGTVVEDGWDKADDSEDAEDPLFMHRLFTYIEDVTPYAEIKYYYGGKAAIKDVPAPEGYLDMVLDAMCAIDTRDTNLDAEEETLYLGLSKTWGSGGGVAYPGKKGLAARYGYNLHYYIAHEMGHCFGLRHTPGTGSFEDSNYPYGFGGATTGWGYSNSLYDGYAVIGKQHIHQFLAEDDHIPDRYSFSIDDYHIPYWDIMSYRGSSPMHLKKFSDYHVEKLKPRAINSLLAQPQPPVVPSAPVDYSQIPGIKLHAATQIWVYGAEAAQAAETKWNLANNIVSTRPPRIPETSDFIDNEVNSLVTASDGQLPKIIFLTLPELEGLEVVGCGR